MFTVFACVTINTADVTTLHINSLKQIFAETVWNTFLRDFLRVK